MDFKAFYWSKTVWLNVGSFLVALLESTQFTNVVPDTWEPTSALIVFAINFWLRLTTTTQLTTSTSRAESLNQ
jgi:hypothetical protein